MREEEGIDSELFGLNAEGTKSPHRKRENEREIERERQRMVTRMRQQSDSETESERKMVQRSDREGIVA